MLTKLLQTSLIFTIRWTESEIEGSSFTQPISTTWVMGLIPFLSLFFPFYCTLFFFPVFRTGSSLTETISVFSIFDFITYTLLLLPLSLSLPTVWCVFEIIILQMQPWPCGLEALSFYLWLLWICYVNFYLIHVVASMWLHVSVSQCV